MRYLLSFLLALGLVGTLLYFYTEERSDQFLQKHVTNLNTAYGAVVQMYGLAAETVYTESVQRPEVSKLLRQGIGKDEEQREIARGMLYRLLYPTYLAMRKRNLKQFHFHQPDGASFLRFHQPDRHGDPLFAKRETVRLANTYRRVVSGFEVGRMAHGFRHVFPVEDEGEHLGTVEVSLGFKAVQQELTRLVPGNRFSFLLKGEVVFPDLFETERSIYVGTELNPEYFYEDLGIKKGGAATPLDPLVLALNRRLSDHATLKRNMAEARAFAVGVKHEDKDYAVSLVPVRDVAGRHAAYLVSYVEAPLLGTYRRDFLAQLAAAAILLGLLVLGMRQLLSGRDALRQSADRLSLAMAGADLGVWDWHIPSGTVNFNDRWARMLGFRLEDIEPRLETWEKLVHPDDKQRVLATLQKHLDGDSPGYESEHRLRNSAGEWCWVLDRGRVLERDAAGEPIRASGTHLDITELKRSQEQLERARDEAVEANRAKSEFLSSMSHELRTPLNAVLGFAQLLESDPVDPLSEDQLDSVKEINRAGRHLLELINEVLDLAKIESGKLEISIEDVNLAAVVQECLSLITPVAEKYAISIDLAQNCDTGIWVRADSTRLKQVLLNLMSNAIKYNREQGRVTIGPASLQDGRVCLPVRDTGFGLTSEQLQQVFQPFTRVGQEGGEIEGTGIGLTISRKLAERMGGQLLAESVPGQGSVFSIVLQAGLTPFELKPEMEQQPSGEKADSTQHRRTLLYIEDNPANLKLVQMILRKRQDLELLSAPNGELGLELAEAHQPDLILLDINLPGMDGYQILKALQEHPRLQHLPVVAVSANALPRDVERGLRAGFLSYLTKPIQVDEFLDMIDTHLA